MSRFHHKELDKRRWKETRERVLTNEPLCRICRRAGFTVAATQVDHIRPVSRGGAVWDWGNLQPLCEPCHSHKTAVENRRAIPVGLDGYPVGPFAEAMRQK